MASEKIRILKIDTQEITTKKGDKRPMRVLHCFVESQYENPETGELVDGSFVAKNSIFDMKLQVTTGDEYIFEYRLGEGYGIDAGRMVPRIVKWTPLSKNRPVAKAATPATV